MNAEPRRSTDYSVRGTVADLTATFAAVLLLITSLMEILQGLAAINDPEFFAAGADYVYDFDVAAWGWVHVILGVVSVCVAIGVMTRQGWAQVLGMIIAGLGMLTNFVWLPHYPLWAIVLIALNGFVIWALSVQLKNYR
jgi:hypothetical protein